MKSHNPLAKGRDKITENLPSKQHRVFEILSTGGKYSVADITCLTHFSDPRGIIRDLRGKGIVILDEWRENAEADGRYKVYFLK